MADDEDYGVATTLSGANEEILSGGEGFSRWKKKRSELETLAAQYEDALRERSQSPYADNTGGRLGQAIWAKNKLEESAPPRYSAVYDDEAKASSVPPAPSPPIPDTDIYEPKGEATYPNTGKGQFQPPPEQLGQPFNLSDAGQVPQGGAQGAPPPIRTFARNTETTPYSVDQRLERDPAYQALGPLARTKYRQLALQADNIRNSDIPMEHRPAVMHDITRAMSELVHVHEEGEKAGAAKAITTIAGQQQAQAAQATPIYSERQKQQISQLQQAEQQYRSMAASGNISQEAMQQGLQDVQQQMQTIKPIGQSGESPNKPGSIKVDQQTGKAYTHDEKGVVQELNNERTLTSLGQLPAHEAHKLISETAALYGENDQQALARLTAREMMVRGQTVPPALLAQMSQGTPHGKAGEKTAHEDVGMSEKEYHAATLARDKLTTANWRADNAQKTDTKPGGKGPLTGTDHDEALDAERKKAGLGSNYQDYRSQKQGAQKQPGQPEQGGAPASAPSGAAGDLLNDRLPKIMAAASSKGDASTKFQVETITKLIKAYPGGFKDMNPQQRYDYVEALKYLRKYDPQIPESMTTKEFQDKIGAKWTRGE